MVRKLIGRTDPVAGRDFLLQESMSVVRLGAAPTCEICVRGNGVSREHAAIVRRNTGYWVEDKGSTNGTFVNGQRVKTERLRHLDVLTIGRSVDLIFIEKTGDANLAAIPAVQSASIAFVDGPSAGSSMDIPLGETRLGRASSCEIVFDHRSIGKQHARILRSEGQVVVEDLESANGTFVNGKRVKTEVLKNGDKITLAGIRTIKVSISTDFKSGASPDSRSQTEMMPVFDQAWRTKLIWSPEELALIEANRGAIIPDTPPRGREAVQPPPPPRGREAVQPPPAPRGKPAMDPLPGRVVTSAAPPEPTLVSRPVPALAPAGTGPIRGVEIINNGAVIQQLGNGSYLIGRSLDAIIRLDRDDREASRTHATLTIRPDRVEIENRSQNGTFHNKQRIEVRAALQDGDEIRCGHMVLIVRFVRS